MTNVKMTVRADCSVQWKPLPLSLKALAHLLPVGEVWPLDRRLPSLPMASIQNKANFPFHQPDLFINF